MRILIQISILILMFIQAKAHHNDSLVKVNNLEKKKGGYFKLLFYPNKTVSFLADQVPIFPGGEDSLQSFISKNHRIPDAYLKSNLNAVVWIPLIVFDNGELIFNGSIFCEEEFTDEAQRLIRLMPKWIPAKLNGKSVHSDIIIPIYISD